MNALENDAGLRRSGSHLLQMSQRTREQRLVVIVVQRMP